MNIRRVLDENNFKYFLKENGLDYHDYDETAKNIWDKLSYNFGEVLIPDYLEGIPIQALQELGIEEEAALALINWIKKSKFKFRMEVNIENKDNALIDAIATTDIENIEYCLANIKYCLFDLKADVNARWGFDKTPLHAAIINIHNNIQVLQFLIDQGANINAQDRFGVSPLHEALIYENFLAAKFLIERGANLHLTFLFERRANVPLTMKGGQTVLQLAAEKGTLEIVELLLIKGADINTDANVGRAAIHYAYERGHHDIVRFLIKNGADLLISPPKALIGVGSISQSTPALQGFFAPNIANFKTLSKDNFGAFLSRQGLSYQDPNVVSSLWETFIGRLSKEHPTLLLNVNSIIDISILDTKKPAPI